MKDGTTYSSSQECLRGGRRDPLSRAEVIKKFETNKQKDVDISIRISNESSLKKIDPDLNIYIYSI